MKGSQKKEALLVDWSEPNHQPKNPNISKNKKHPKKGAFYCEVSSGFEPL